MRKTPNPLFTGELGKSRKLLVLDGVLQNAAAILTMGVFLSGYLVWLEGSDFITGLVNSSVNWASITVLFSFLIFERLRHRKRLLIVLTATARLLICGSVFVPLLVPDKTVALPMVAGMVILGSFLAALYGTGFTVWMFGVLPMQQRSEFIYLRTFWLRIAFTLTTVLGGFLLDAFQKGYGGFLLLFSLSLGLSLMDIILLIQVKEPEYELDTSVRPTLRMLAIPARDKTFRSYLIFVFLFYVVLTMSGTFTPVYLVRYMQFDYSFISTMNVLQYACLIAFTSFWRRMEAKRGLVFVLRVTATIAVVEFLMYGLLTTRTAWILPIATMLAGIGYSGFNITILNYRYSILPEKNRTVYESLFAAVFGLSTLLSPMIGNFLMNRMPVLHNAVFEHSRFQLMYLLSFVLVQGVLFLSFNTPSRRRLIKVHAPE
jgi:hypothetical protein